MQPMIAARQMYQAYRDNTGKADGLRDFRGSPKISLQHQSPGNDMDTLKRIRTAIRCTGATLLIVATLIMAGCHEDGPAIKVSDKTIVSRPDTVQNGRDAMEAERSSLKRLNEPVLQGAGIETYRFVIMGVSRPSYIFRIEQLPDGKFQMISKCLLVGSPGHKPFYKGKEIDLIRDSIVETTIQSVSSEDWESFKGTLAGSYYWAINLTAEIFTYDCFDFRDVLILESKSPVYRPDSLSTHSVHVKSPQKGSFRDACVKLIRLSKLTRTDKDLRERLDN
jgi:hypothetical protein